MRNFFNYDNKFMQLLMTVGDLLILNVLYLLCCLPIFTIGAAQAGLSSGLRVLTNKEDDSSCAVAFFKGFANGFGKITIAFLIVLVLIVVTGYTAVSVMFFDVNGVSGAPVFVSIIALCICAIFQTLISIFHSRFSCSVWQLFRNTWLLMLAHPLRCILSAALVWSPIILFLLDLQTFMLITPIFLVLYYSFMFLLVNSIMKKPFDSLITMFNERNDPEKSVEEATEETGSVQEIAE